MILSLVLHFYFYSSLAPGLASAADPMIKPARPSQAETLFKPESSCNRTFIYRNRTYSVDSSRKLDGEGLRFVLQQSSQAEAMLNDYQNRAKLSRISGFVTTFGFALAAGGSLYSATISNTLGNRDTRNAFLFSGVFLAIAGYGYGQYALKEKEKVLEKAIETYNDAVPEPEHIRVNLLPTPTGTGGEVKTIVPF